MSDNENEAWDNYAKEVDEIVSENDAEDSEDSEITDSTPKKKPAKIANAPDFPEEEIEEDSGDEEAEEESEEDSGDEEAEEEFEEDSGDEDPLTEIELVQRDYSYQQSIAEDLKILREANETINQQLSEEAISAWFIDAVENQKINPAVAIARLTQGIAQLNNKKEVLTRRAEVAMQNVAAKVLAEADARYRGPAVDPADFNTWVANNQGLVESVKQKHGFHNPKFVLDVVAIYHSMKSQKQKGNKSAEKAAKLNREKRKLTKSPSSKKVNKANDGFDMEDYKKLHSRGG